VFLGTTISRYLESGGLFCFLAFIIPTTVTTVETIVTITETNSSIGFPPFRGTGQKPPTTCPDIIQQFHVRLMQSVNVSRNCAPKQKKAYKKKPLFSALFYFRPFSCSSASTFFTLSGTGRPSRAAFSNSEIPSLLTKKNIIAVRNVLPSPDGTYSSVGGQLGN